MANTTSIITRNYLDNFSVKEYMMNDLIPKYFNNPEYISYLNIGTFGIISEEIGNVTEDAFNTASVFLRESFPIKAQLPESIYTHAAVFQLDNFATTSRCGFMLALDFDTVINNFQTKNNGNYFYIDKDTTFLVEDIPFVLDYDIEIKAVKREEYRDRYIFSAQYVLSEYENSISGINNPYIPIAQVHIDGNPSIILPSLATRQMQRVEEEELIVNNSIINFPTFDIKFNGQLAGIDVLYRKPSEDEYRTQLETKVLNSLPSKKPFCYYHIKDSETITVSFTTRDTFFQPEFNSRIKVILYLTDGSDGNFLDYTGSNIKVITQSDRYHYNNGCVIAARNLDGGAKGGTNMKSIDALQSITVENFSTATALTTDSDLNVYFKNYLYRHGTDILFIKKRDDMRERLYGGFYVIKKGKYIYPTNTLHLSTNIHLFEKTDTDSFIIRPGVLFKYNNSASNDTLEIFNDELLYYQNYEAYLAYIKDNPYYYPEDEQDDLPSYLRGPITYERWKLENGLTDYHTIYDEGMDAYEGISDFLYANPFLICYRKNPSMIGLYLTLSDQVSTLDFKLQNELSFVQFISYGFWMKRELSQHSYYSDYRFETRVMPSIDSGTTFITNYNSLSNISNNALRVFVSVMDGSYECCTFELIPESIENGVYVFGRTIQTDDYITNNNKIHLINKDNEIVNTGNYNEVYVPLCDNVFRIYTLFNESIEEHPTINYNVHSDLTEPPFKQKLALDDYTVTNVYSTETNKLYFIKPLNLLRNTLIFSDYTVDGIDVGDCVIRSLPFVKYDIMQDKKKLSYFLNEFLTHYVNIDLIVKERLRNTTYIDLKFYNTYGKSKNFIIGDQNTFIDTVNLKISFDVWLVSGTNFLLATTELKAAIKDYIEDVNKQSGGNFYLSNLTQIIENDFAYVDHLRFLGINNYDTYYQSITNVTEDIDSLTRDERRWYIPELLNIEESNIRLNMRTV